MSGFWGRKGETLMFSAKEVKTLIDAHRGILDGFQEILTAEEGAKEKIVVSAKALVSAEVLKHLEEIPIEEINRDKQGFRTKPLRDGGYTTFADLAEATVAEIENLPGIGPESALSIKNFVDEIASKMQEGIYIRLSEDNKTRESEALVRTLSDYYFLSPIVKEVHLLQTQGSKKLEQKMESAFPLTKKLRRHFLSQEKKREAVESTLFLKDLMSSTYGEYSDRVFKKYMHWNLGQFGDPWKEFVKHPVEFYHLLEKFCPQFTTGEDLLYGLPETLADEIRDEELLLEGLKCQLRPYQEWGVKYILHQGRVLLGDEMGLGKTIQGIAAMVCLRNKGATRFLVVCPAGVLINWCREIEKRSDLTLIKIHGKGREEALQEWTERGGVAVTTYETTRRFPLEKMAKIDLLIVDEAHYIKNPQAQRTKNVKSISKSAEDILLMTGTPLENRIGEMIGLIELLSKETAARIEGMAFLSTAPKFKREIATVYYRRKREDVLKELPELIETEEWCTLRSKEREIYEYLAMCGAPLAILRQLSWNVGIPEESSKALRLKEILERVEDEERKIIVFSFFLKTLKLVEEVVGNKCIGTITGAASPGERLEIIDRFDKAPPGSVLVSQIEAGGTGLNIQSASVIILCEPQFKPSIENQAIARAYRMGQTRNVLVFRLLCEDTIDENLMKMVEEKQMIFDTFADESAAVNQMKDLDKRAVEQMVERERQKVREKVGENWEERMKELGNKYNY